MAYRGLPRPSSPHDAKASIVRPYTLGKKSNLASRYVAILFNSTLSVFNDRKNGADASGGGSRIRTGDFLLAKQALYQLSYAPVGDWWA